MSRAKVFVYSFVVILFWFLFHLLANHASASNLDFWRSLLEIIHVLYIYAKVPIDKLIEYLEAIPLKRFAIGLCATLAMILLTFTGSITYTWYTGGSAAVGALCEKILPGPALDPETPALPKDYILAYNSTSADKIEPGDTIKFGHYSQEADGKETKSIEWIILDMKESEISGNAKYLVLISRYGLDTCKYNSDYKITSWENSGIRAWLNNSFLTDAFTQEEQALILSMDTSLEDSSVQESYVQSDSAKNTDKVYLLSDSEYETYFKQSGIFNPDSTVDSELMRGQPTPFAISQCKNKITENSFYWWLKTSGINGYSACSVTVQGFVDPSHNVDDSYGIVRPVICIIYG